MTARLAEAVRQRRAELSLNLIQVRDRGGPRAPVMVRIERGDANTLTDEDLASLDRALEWTMGSASAVLHGGSPTPREVAEVQFVHSGVTISHGEVAALTAATFWLQELGSDRKEDGELIEGIEALAQAVAPLYGQFVTELLAANSHGVGSNAVVDAIAPLLESRANSEMDEGAALRRWLAESDVERERRKDK